jgi:hypothetical protein
MITRRNLLVTGGILLVMNAPRRRTRAQAQPASPKVDLLSAPLELVGEWGGSPQGSAAVVIGRMREVCLTGFRLLSDQQPEKIRVDDHSSGPPAIWLHDKPPQTAWIIVDIGARAWCQLAYQFGHELGHVLCNSWGPQAKPAPPCQWLEEAMVEAFSIRGLALLADSWERDPPFPGDAPYANAIREYRANLIAKYSGERAADDDLAAWFRAHRGSLPQGVSEAEGPAILAILAELERDKACVEDMAALNRWPGRTGVPVEEYLSLWQQSCAELGAAGHLPGRLLALLQVG